MFRDNCKGCGAEYVHADASEELCPDCRAEFEAWLERELARLPETVSRCGCCSIHIRGGGDGLCDFCRTVAAGDYIAQTDDGDMPF